MGIFFSKAELRSPMVLVPLLFDYPPHHLHKGVLVLCCCKGRKMEPLVRALPCHHPIRKETEVVQKGGLVLCGLMARGRTEDALMERNWEVDDSIQCLVSPSLVP
ncbi:unnamed protein product [Urochloa humidicola]